LQAVSWEFVQKNTLSFVYWRELISTLVSIQHFGGLGPLNTTFQQSLQIICSWLTQVQVKKIYKS